MKSERGSRMNGVVIDQSLVSRRYNIQMSVKVGVRVRPFNQREKDLNCKLCVDMIGPMTRLLDADDAEKHRDFTFDYSFWSHDSFHTNEAGYFEGDSDKYSDQQRVFELVGLEILANAWEGYHCCLFAYGQTGAGKSYSMVGYGANKGIVPISCEEIFRRISANTDKNKEYEVNVSMLQIYNEKVQDLLIPINKRTKQGLKIREHKTLGVYVEDLSKHCVNTYQSIEQKMDEGSRNRSIAATEMNASSSRAHTIISIEFRQIQLVDGRKMEKLSVIYLVDLAGSEKVGKTGATGDRLKEAAGINKSLSVLGLVISTLADKAMGKGKAIVVPYRDSCLTRILQNALGGNSKTLMICAISPASDNYQETLSTLRYADQAKKIQNKAVVNESDADKKMRLMTKERDELCEKLQKWEEMMKRVGLTPQMLSKMDEDKQQLRHNMNMIQDYSMTKTQKLRQQEEVTRQTLVKKIDLNRPHLSNICQDPQLSRLVNYSIDFERVRVGKRNAEPKNDIEIDGMGIRPLQAVIEKTEEGFYIEPIYEAEKESGCLLNGDSLLVKTKLANFDRLAFGTNIIYLVLIPGTAPRVEIEQSAINFQFVQNELYLKKERIQEEKMEQQINREKKQVEIRKQQEIDEIQISLKKREDELDQVRKMLQAMKEEHDKDKEKLIQQEQEKVKQIELERFELQKKKSERDTKDEKEKIKEKYYFEKKLLKTLPKCIQLNLIAKEFKRNISMSVKMLIPSSEGDEDDGLDIKKRSIMVKVVNREVGYAYWWNAQKLSNRFYIIKDLAEKYFEDGILPIHEQCDDDPFWDPPQHVLIGRAFLTTKALAYLFDNPVNLTVIGEDDHCGELIVNVQPTDSTGTRNLSEEIDEDGEFEPQELLAKPFYFNVFIESAKIPNNYQNIYVEYSVKTSQNTFETFRTGLVETRTKNPVFNYKQLHQFKMMTRALLNYISNAKIYGHEMCEIPSKEQKGAKGKGLSQGEKIGEMGSKEEAKKVKEGKTPSPGQKVEGLNMNKGTPPIPSPSQPNIPIKQPVIKPPLNQPQQKQQKKSGKQGGCQIY